jgi:hypothetical protein
MERTIHLNVSANEAAEIEQTLESMDKGLRRILKDLRQDQAEIEKLKKQTRTILAELKAA